MPRRLSTKGYDMQSQQRHIPVGKVYVMMDRMDQKGICRFSSALGVDPTYLEAQMQIALLHVELGNQDAEKAIAPSC